jgi:hypothetical protein
MAQVNNLNKPGTVTQCLVWCQACIDFWINSFKVYEAIYLLQKISILIFDKRLLPKYLYESSIKFAYFLKSEWPRHKTIAEVFNHSLELAEELFVQEYFDKFTNNSHEC